MEDLKYFTIFDLCAGAVCVNLYHVMMYGFVLGRNKELSIAELGAVLGAGILSEARSGVVFYEGELPGKPQEFLNRLGGTMEIMEIFAQGILVKSVEEEIEKYLKKAAALRPGKCNFALTELPEKSQSRLLRFLLPRIKKSLRAAEISANFMNKDFKNVSPVFASKQGLVERGTNISIIDEGGGKVSLGFSVAMQDFEAYSNRDYGKPFRDARVGMLPPKLAQIMINLASNDADNNDVPILDPFCGTGTILVEGLLMGRTVIGSDADGRMAEGAKKNLDWTAKNFPRAKSAYHVFQKNATALATKDIPLEGALAVVTEPHLGPPMQQSPSMGIVENAARDLTQIYTDFFKKLATWLPAGTPIVFIFPAWKMSSAKGPAFGGPRIISLAERLVDKIKELGYSVATFDPLKKTSLFYDRPDSVVGREIIKFVKS